MGISREEFKVHKNILAEASAVWCRMLATEFNEKKTDTCNIDHIDPKIFRALLRFVYCGELPENFAELVFDLYKAAHQYEIEALEEMCADQMKKELSAENSLQTFAIAHRYSLDLAEEAWKVIQR